LGASDSDLEPRALSGALGAVVGWSCRSARPGKAGRRRGEVGPGTTRSIYGLLRAALNAAINAELLARSPARAIKLPQTPKTDVVTLRPQEPHRLAAALPDPWQPMVDVAGACGLRFSEVAGLSVARVELAITNCR
jgi:integrase